VLILKTKNEKFKNEGEMESLPNSVGGALIYKVWEPLVYLMLENLTTCDLKLAPNC
jgi:hypothetical protein